MKQAPLIIEAPEVPPVTGAAEPVDLQGCSALIDDGLLMVFGPDGDPLPPEVFTQAAQARPEASMTIADQPVPVARIAAVLNSQRLDRPAPPDGGGWLRSMLGLGPAPEEAGAEELAAEERLELIRFGRELVVTTPAQQVFLVRPARADDEEAGLSATDTDGAELDHDALLDALLPETTTHGSAAGPTVEPAGPGIVLTLAGVKIHLAPAEAAVAGSIVCAVSGEAIGWREFRTALLGTPPAWDERLTAAEEAPAAAGDQHALDALPDRLIFDEHGFVDLAWLGELLGRAGGRITGLFVRALPAAVRFSAGRAGEGGWRLAPEDLPGLAMFATTEGLEPFTLEVVAEGPATPPSFSIPVLPEADRDPEPGTGQPLAVALDFPPPFSARNRLDYFAVVMVGGLPPGATLSAGVPSAGGRWTLAPDDLRGLRAHLPAGVGLPCTLEVVGITIENREGMLSSARRTLTIGAPDDPTAGSAPATATVDLRPLLEAAGADRRIDAVALTGLPPVVALSSGTHDAVSGCWVLRANELSDLTMSVRDPALRQIAFKARAIVIDGQGGASAISQTLEVEVPDPTPEALEPVSTGPGFFRSLGQRRA